MSITSWLVCFKPEYNQLTICLVCKRERERELCATALSKSCERDSNPKQGSSCFLDSVCFNFLLTDLNVANRLIWSKA